MPSGHTHDRITWICFPFVTIGGYAISQSWSVAIASGASFLFSGFMFGPDLDIHSKQYRRWGWLRWLWIPYQSLVPHRSWVSHGPIIGTVGRVLYLGVCISLGLVAVALAQGLPWNYWFLSPKTHALWPIEHESETIGILLGLELGAFSHYASDWLGSQAKRLKGFK